ncbi:myotubularin-related protein 6 isoform X1 [Neocloeon triangulifer]|uniref:myotubularin-related protein 6 isoform X1 n=2 Tax=Neocloeon triangulifer TaxID=2078957 RepID=UPI00286F72FD|nr:myotubularin-related protein 6 isoform X1 [Neocloeon triangulifer]
MSTVNGRNSLSQDQTEPSMMDVIRLPKVEGVRMLDRFNVKKSFVGVLYLTATHLIFVDPESKKETWILHMHILSADKLPLTTMGSPLQIRCKTFLSVTFVLPKERDCQEIFTTLQQLSKPVQIEELYCFDYTASTEEVAKHVGWSFFDLQAEFQRMRVPNEAWSLTLLNKDHELCDTYPRYLYVPASASTSVLMGSSSFRSKGRLPVLSYLHTNKAAICRCSQPLSGFSARCLEDEQMLNCILRANPNSKFMYVVDTRPKINAMANRAAGKGYENENFYENIKFQFIGIENIHIMRSSLQKLLEACELKGPSMNNFLGGIEASGWLRHIKAVLDTSLFIVQAVQEGVSVVVHCSDGWDRTAQVCSLASLFLDPFHRTLQGFQALIEREWLAFGHKFVDRCGFLAGDHKEVSPIFTQFLECVWQLTNQYPLTFQFNERFLLALHDHVQSCQYGTFVGNCEKDRLDLRLHERTYSLWGYIANHMNEFMNPLYAAEENTEVLIPNLAPQNIRFWRGMYCRFENGVHPREVLGDMLLAICDHSASLEDHIRLLNKRIETLRSKIDAKKKVETKKEEKIEDCVDNKTSYDKGSPEQDEEVFRDEKVEITVTAEQLASELKSVAIEWKTLRNVRECNCSTPFDHSSRKCHCWKCGDVFCTRCIDKHTALPGHDSQRAVPVCRTCFRELRRTFSVDSA